MQLPRVFAGMAAATLLGSAAVAAPVQGNANDTAPQFHNSARHAGADPFVLWDEATLRYYAYSTEGADEGFNFAIYSSPDLSTWHRHPGGVLRACQDADMNPLEGGQACWARDWFWAPEVYHNEKTGWYFFFFAGRLREDLTKDYFRYSEFEEPSKIGVVVSRSPTGPWAEIESRPIDYYPFDPEYHDVNLVMDEKQMLPPATQEEGRAAPKGTYIPTIDINLFFDEDERVWMYLSRNAYRNWNWDAALGKYIEESNIIVVEMDRSWWDDPDAATMPDVVEAERDARAADAPRLPCNITSYNGVGEIGRPPRKDGWHTVISYGADPQEWENYHVDDYAKYAGARKDRRWSEGSTLIKRTGVDGEPVYLLTYSANNYEASNYGVGFATAASPLGPFRKAAANPVLAQRPDGDAPIYSTGHGSIVASPPRGGEPVGAQDVTLRTPAGAELFYVHHGRNDTERARSIFTTRMEVRDDAVFVGSDGAISMSLTPLDQPLPRNTYPLTVEAECAGSGRLVVRALSKPGAPFDLQEGSNRVVAMPGERVASSMQEDAEHEGAYVVSFGDAAVDEVAYQRLLVDGSWTTVVSSKVKC
jgi:beta-xylosidase